MHAEQAYRSATAVSLSVAIGAAALCALAVTWYLSRRLAAVGDCGVNCRHGSLGGKLRGQSPRRRSSVTTSTHLRRPSTKWRSVLESAESMRRRLLADLAHEIRTPVAVLEAFMEALEDGVEALDDHTIAMLRDQTRRLHGFPATSRRCPMPRRIELQSNRHGPDLRYW